MKNHIPLQLAAREMELSESKFVTLFRHGSLEIEYYKPDKVDLQKPHDRDEIYVVSNGHGIFVLEDEKCPFTAGDVLFVPAGVVHRFESFSDDFATWVFFYGSIGGEKTN